MPRISDEFMRSRQIPKRYLDKRTDKKGRIYYVVPKEVLETRRLERDINEDKIDCARNKRFIRKYDDTMMDQIDTVSDNVKFAGKKVDDLKKLVKDKKRAVKDKKKICGGILPKKKQLRKEIKADIKKNKKAR